MTEEEKKRLEEEKAQQEATDRAIAYARSVGYDVSGQQAPATQPEQPVTQPTTLPNAQNSADALNQNAPATVQTPAPTTAPATQPKPQTTQIGSVKDTYTGMYNDAMRTGEDVISAKSDYLRNQADFLRQQNAARQKADDEAWQQVLNGQKTLQQYWIDRDNEAKAEVARAKEEDRQRTEMENRRAGLVGAGEVAASLINLFSVGQLHASNQVYKDHMQDWMRKADMDRKYRTMRMDQLKERQRGIGDKKAAIEAANTQAAYDHYVQDAAKRDKANADVFNIANSIPLQEAQGREALAEKGNEILAKGAQAADQSAQGWARINETKRQFNAEMKAKGLNEKGEPDEELMKKITEIKSRVAVKAKQGVDYKFVDMNGNVNIANMDPKEYEDLLALASRSILKDLGAADAREFESDMRKALDDEAKNAVLKDWMAKSPICGAAIRLADPTYAGVHGSEPPKETENTPGFANNDKKEDPDEKERKGYNSQTYWGK